MKIVKVIDLRVGDLVDLEGDIFADPHHDNPALELEYAEVQSVCRETLDCVCVYFDSITVGFPINHHVRLPQAHPALEYECEHCGKKHANEFSRTCCACDRDRESGDLEI